MGASHSPNLDHLFRPETLRTAIATAFPLPEEHDKPFSARETRVEKIALKHSVMLGRDRQDDGRISTCDVDGDGRFPRGGFLEVRRLPIAAETAMKKGSRWSPPPKKPSKMGR